MIQHLSYLFGHEGDRPSEKIKEVGQQIGVRALHELLDVEGVADELDDSALVVVVVAVVGGGEDGDDGGEFLLPHPLVHLEAL